MSLEQHLEALTITVAALTAVTQQLTQVMMTASVSLPSPSATSTVPAAAPAFAPPVPPAGVPFNDLPSLMKYAGDVYQQIEQKQPGSGAHINQVILQAGVPNGNMNDATPQHFPALYQGLESLKASILGA